ncbi:toxin YoeB [Dyadobacter soli]|uniref:Putative mRNA interferase YoeB n=1 Tax=Dyadobacter soli TaxID=659014 RepID=A0A1G7IXS5_9BACT|nr:Txe/YoeB family addiction module toxin [Dyadobacter soli]SDF17471.1 toxin YoeB [Dyadobacter soli]
MEIELTSDALKDLQHWKKSGNARILQRVRQLLDAIQTSPFQGIGKPEGLKGNLSGKWSRRIDKEHRMVYSVNDDKIVVFSLKGHYKFKT